MARSYPFLIAGLPELAPDTEIKGFNVNTLKAEIEELLSGHDLELFEWLFLPFDNRNLLALIQGKEHFSALGSIPLDELKEGVRQLEGLPSYMISFLEGYTGKDIDHPEKQHAEFPDKDLWDLFYAQATKLDSEFLRKWFTFDMELRDVLTGIMARKAKKEVRTQLVGEGEVPEAILASNSPDFGLKWEKEWIEPLLQIVDIPNIMEREKKIDLLKWDQLDSLMGMRYFDIENVLALMQKALIVDRWMQWNVQTGRELFTRLLSETKGSFDLQQVFATN